MRPNREPSVQEGQIGLILLKSGQTPAIVEASCSVDQTVRLLDHTRVVELFSSKSSLSHHVVRFSVGPGENWPTCSIVTRNCAPIDADKVVDLLEYAKNSFVMPRHVQSLAVATVTLGALEKSPFELSFQIIRQVMKRKRNLPKWNKK